MSKTLTHDQLHQRARLAFERSGLTQIELSERLGVPQPNISRALSKGATKDASTLLAIVRELDGKIFVAETIYRRV